MYIMLQMFNNYMKKTAPPPAGASIAPRINTAQSIGVPTPQDKMTKRPGAATANQQTKKGRWDSTATGRKGIVAFYSTPNRVESINS